MADSIAQHQIAADGRANESSGGLLLVGEKAIHLYDK